MGRAPCCDKTKVKRGPWSPEEDAKLKLFIEKHGTGGNWIALPTKAGLKRCGKSCRLRWLNYLRPNIKHGEFSDAEDRIICSLYATIGSKWSIIAAQLPGRTDNDIKNYWNTKLKKKLMGISTSKRRYHQKPQQQEYHHQPHLFLPPLLAPNTPIPSMSTAHYPCPKPLPTGLENLFSISQGSLNNFTTITTTTPMKQPQYHTRESEVSSTSNLLMFGGESRCTSSDGSSNHINLSKEMDYGFVDGVYGQPMWMVNLFDKHGLDGVDLGVFGEASTFDLGIEDFKHLITSTSECNCFFPFG